MIKISNQIYSKMKGSLDGIADGLNRVLYDGLFPCIDRIVDNPNSRLNRMADGLNWVLYDKLFPYIDRIVDGSSVRRNISREKRRL